MKQYTDLLKEILTKGNTRGDRTKTGTLSLFGRQMVFDLNEGFPLLTLKNQPFRSIVAELLGFIKGYTNNNDFLALGCSNKIWGPWALAENAGDLRHLSNFERVTLYAEKQGITAEEAKAVLYLQGPESEGHAFLDEADIPRTELMIKHKQGALGPIYGYQWRNWITKEGKVVDQLQELVDGLKSNPFSRRHIVNAWNVGDLPDETRNHAENIVDGKMVLPPCHVLFQMYVTELTMEQRLDWWNNQPDNAVMRMALDDEAFEKVEETMELFDKMDIPKCLLSCKMYQRSADMMLGVPFNIASYALLTHLIANECGYGVDELIMTFGDTHIYANHIAGCTEMLTRRDIELPTLNLPKTTTVFNAEVEDIIGALEGYCPHNHIPFDVAV